MSRTPRYWLAHVVGTAALLLVGTANADVLGNIGKMSGNTTKLPSLQSSQGASSTGAGGGSASGGGGCEAEANRIQAKIADANARVSTMGMCEGSKKSVELLSDMAALLARCPTLDPTGQDQGSYAAAAAQAQQTVNEICM